jgi:hypothetical protein
MTHTTCDGYHERDQFRNNVSTCSVQSVIRVFFIGAKNMKRANFLKRHFLPGTAMWSMEFHSQATFFFSIIISLQTFSLFIMRNRKE